MEGRFEALVRSLYEQAVKWGRLITNDTSESGSLKKKGLDESEEVVPEDFKSEFFSLIDKVNLSLMEDEDNFYGYFLIQMGREIKFDMSSPTGVNFKGAKYIIYFNPVIFLTLNMNQMQTSIKHEILHILSMHLTRAREFEGRLSKIAINMAMDIVVNKYLDYLPPFATTLERVNLYYSLKLEPYKPFEYYAEQLQVAIDLLEEDKDAAEDEDRKDENAETEFDPEKTHDIWEESSDIDEKTLREFTEKVVNESQKGTVNEYLQGMIASLKNSKAELPWNLYLSRLMGTIESNKKKTVTRRSRRQPERLDLRGELRDHKAKIAVALDISGSISDGEFKQAVKEVLNIVKNYNHEITIIECDDEIRRTYKVNSINDIKDRLNIRGGTKYNPVIEYANNNRINLLVYFTDGQGENALTVKPRGYKIMWVITGRGDKLSLKEAYGPIKKLRKVEENDNILDILDVERGGFSMNNQERLIERV